MQRALWGARKAIGLGALSTQGARPGNSPFVRTRHGFVRTRHGSTGTRDGRSACRSEVSKTPSTPGALGAKANGPASIVVCHPGNEKIRNRRI